MTVLCLNVGSSSLKYALYHREERITRGVIEGVDVVQAVSQVWERLDEEPDAVGHRLVRGADAPMRITADLLAELRRQIPLAPLHLPSEIAVIEAVWQHRSALPQVACFDTAFHAHLPKEARLFALPRELAKEGIYRYGFHGLSYESIVSALGGDLPERLVVAHLGNGVSLAAIERGRSIDTTMGFTPTGGVMMGTRSGDLDPGILLYLLRERGYDVNALERLVNRESGLLGVSGTSSDVRTLLKEGSDAITHFCYQIRKAIGALTATLGGIDMLVFTGGVGEHATAIREAVVGGLRYLQIPHILTMPADEERIIAHHTCALT